MDVSGWDVSNGHSFFRMFINCAKVKELDVSGWDMHNATTMYELFSHCTTITSLAVDGEGWVFPNCSSLGYTFAYCASLETIPISGWNVSHITDLQYTFWYLYKVRDIPTQNWDVSNVVNFFGTFRENYDLPSSGLHVGNWNVSSGVDFHEMFYGCYQVDDFSGVSGWNVSNGTNFSHMFTKNNQGNCQTIPVGNWDVSNGVNFAGMFYECTRLTSLPVENWNVSKGENFRAMFCGVGRSGGGINSLDLSGWDMGHATSFYGHTMGNNLMYGGMFENAKIYSLDVSGWDTSSVTNMEKTFKGCSADVLDLSEWDLDNVTTMKDMFTGMTWLYKLKLPDISAATYMTSDANYAIFPKKMFTLDMVRTAIAADDMVTAFDGTCYQAEAQIDSSIPSDTWIYAHFYWYARFFSSDGETQYTSLHASNMRIPNDWTLTYTWGSTKPSIPGKILVGWSYTPNKDTADIIIGTDIISRCLVKTIEGLDTEEDTSDDIVKLYAVWEDAPDAYLKTGQEFNALLKKLANASAEYYTDDITQVDIKWSETAFTSTTNVATDAGSPVYARLNTSGTDPFYELYTDATHVYFNADSRRMFAFFKKMPAISFLSDARVDSSTMTNASYMFQRFGMNLEDKPSLDLTGLDVSNTTDFSYMFIQTKAETINTEGWDTSNAQQMQNMFMQSYLATLDLSDWNMSNVTNIHSMFSNCLNLTEINVTGWNLENCKSFDFVFYYCRALEDLDVSGWNVSEGTSFVSMFASCEKLTSIDVKDWRPEKATSLSTMFYGCLKLGYLDLSGWDVTNCSNFSFMLKSCPALKCIDAFKTDVNDTEKPALSYSTFRLDDNKDGMADAHTQYSAFIDGENVSHRYIVLPDADVMIGKTDTGSDLYSADMKAYSITTSKPGGTGFIKNTSGTTPSVDAELYIKRITDHFGITEEEMLSKTAGISCSYVWASKQIVMQYYYDKDYTGSWWQVGVLEDADVDRSEAKLAAFAETIRENTGILLSFNADSYGNGWTNNLVLINCTPTDSAFLPGATLKLTDLSGNDVTSWTSESRNSVITLYPGSFILKEIATPEGYETAADITFVVHEDGTVTIGADTVSAIWMSDARLDAWLKTGKEVNAALKKLYDSSATYTTPDNTIRSVKWTDTAFTTTTNIAETGAPVYARLTGNDIELYSVANVVHFNADSSYLLADLVAASDLSFLSTRIETSAMTDASSMFFANLSLVSVDLSRFDVQNTTNMFGMFEGCSCLGSLDIDEWDVSKVTNFSEMFDDTDKLYDLDIKFIFFSFCFCWCKFQLDVLRLWDQVH